MEYSHTGLTIVKKLVWEPKDLQKVWRKVKEIKHGIRLPACPIQVLNNEFPTPADKANEFVSIFAQHSQPEDLSLKDQ